MATSSSYLESVQQEMGELIDTLDLSDLQKKAIRGRWLDQVLWMERKANQVQSYYYRLRLLNIIGGVVLTALVSLNVGDFGNNQINQSFRRWFPLSLAGLSLSVTLSAAIEEFFQFGTRWRHYRRTAEMLKSEGWQFLQLSGSYQQVSCHKAAYPAFSTRVEQLIKQDLDVFITEVVQEQGNDESNEPSPAVSPTVLMTTAAATAGKASFPSQRQALVPTVTSPLAPPDLLDTKAELESSS
ncbi:DUF4231 domain-containing protein [Trichothermofontia sp.]